MEQLHVYAYCAICVSLCMSKIQTTVQSKVQSISLESSLYNYPQCRKLIGEEESYEVVYEAYSF